MSNAIAEPQPGSLKARRPLKKGVVGAILAVQQEVGILVKSDRNKFANYDFVPIDSYYEAVAPLAAKHGLSWKVNLVNAKKGADDVYFDVVIDLIFRDERGSEWEYKGYAQMAIFHQYIGPQTTGSASSYANKAFMRDTFKVPSTGETDPDALKQPPRKVVKHREVGGPPIRDEPYDGYSHLVDEGEGPPPPPPPPEPPFDAAGFERDMVAFAEGAATQAALEGRWTDWLPTLRTLEQKDTTRYGRIKKAFADRKAVLLRQAKARVEEPRTIPEPLPEAPPAPSLPDTSVGLNRRLQRIVVPRDFIGR